MFAAVITAPARARADDDDYNKIGMCYSTDDRVECSAGPSEAELAEYLASQCNFWSNSEKECREVVRCSKHGYFVVSFDNKKGRLHGYCGVANERVEEAAQRVTAACGRSSCQTLRWRLGPYVPRGGGDGGDSQEQPTREDEERLRAEEERRREEAQRRAEEERRRAEEQRRREEQERLEEEREAREEAQARREEEQRSAEERRRDEAEAARLARERAEAERRERIDQGFRDLAEAQAANDALGDAVATGAATVFMAGGGEDPSPFSNRMVHVEFGFGPRFMPVMTNTSGPDVRSHSSQDSGGGLGMDFGFRYWPAYQLRYGVGFGARAGAAGAAMPGGSLYSAEAGITAHAYLGSRVGWSLRAEAGLTGRVVGSSSNLFGAITTGSGSYRVRRVGGGVRKCLSRMARTAGDHCKTHVGATVVWDLTSLDEPARVVRFDLLMRGFLGVVGAELEYGSGYPAPGETTYELDEDRLGTYFVFRLRKAWTWF